jgi:hypothetical protein
LLDDSVMSTLEVIEEPSTGLMLTRPMSDKVVVDLDALWA